MQQLYGNKIFEQTNIHMCLYFLPDYYFQIQYALIFLKSHVVLTLGWAHQLRLLGLLAKNEYQKVLFYLYNTNRVQSTQKYRTNDTTFKVCIASKSFKKLGFYNCEKMHTQKTSKVYGQVICMQLCISLKPKTKKNRNNHFLCTFVVREYHF